MPRVNEQTLYDELVGLCYECVLDASAWQNLLSSLAEATGRQQGALLFWNQRNSGGQVSNVYRLEPKAAEAYNSYYCNLDPTRLYMSNRTVGNWYHDTQELGLERIRRDPYYQEYQLPFGMKSLSCVKLHKVAQAEVFLSLVINKDAHPPKEQQQRLLNRLTPHLIKAAQLSDKIDGLELELAKRDLLLDQHPAPLWLTDGEGHVVYCNGAAQRHMHLAGSSLYENFGRLHCKTQDARLQQLLRQAASKGAANRAGWLRLSTPTAQDVLITPVPARCAVQPLSPTAASTAGAAGKSIPERPAGRTLPTHPRRTAPGRTAGAKPDAGKLRRAPRRFPQHRAQPAPRLVPQDRHRAPGRVGAALCTRAAALNMLITPPSAQDDSPPRGELCHATSG
ncbi:helix-turn-helix transcriptional regulator [Pseudomonas sp.]|uniref:helix-turn-helix transcriptional regulator n=1 Tax=Pseudomonas sp. TaxID=306 RepID=UPI003524BC10